MGRLPSPLETGRTPPPHPYQAKPGNGRGGGIVERKGPGGRRAKHRKEGDETASFRGRDDNSRRCPETRLMRCDAMQCDACACDATVLEPNLGAGL
jgi:hypothetical protein